MEKTVYELMHGEKVVADIGTNGVCTVLDRSEERRVGKECRL